MALRISDLSDYEIKQIVDAYLKFYATMESVAKIFKTSPATISNILFKAVSENNIIDDISAQAVVDKATGFTENVVRTRKRWQKALTLRNKAAIQDEIKYKQQRVRELEFQFETYDDYFIDEDDAPSKRSLWCEIGRLKGEIKLLEKQINI